MTIVISLVGVYAVQENLRNLLFVYVISLILIMCAQIAFANSLVLVSHKFAIQETVVSGSLVHLSDVTINNLAMSVYVKCCSGCPSGCNNSMPNSFSTQILPYCGDNQCEFVGPCASKTQDKCFNYFLNNGFFKRPVEVPTDLVDDSVCNLLSGLSYNSLPLVGFAVSGGCGYGDARIFHQNLADYVTSRSYGSSVVVVLLATTEIIVLLICMYIVFCAKHGLKDYEQAPSDTEGVLLQSSRVDVNLS